MGKGFGELAYVRGVVKYSLSPFEQKAFANAISVGVPNMFRRFRTSVLRVTTPLLLTYMIYTSVENAHAQTVRKAGIAAAAAAEAK